ncbi:MAG: TatD family hydrolase [Candidatus Atribacteria bacterium]|nr:TatD family hydrolase [Candidatus Atribacteria bacterium]
MSFWIDVHAHLDGDEFRDDLPEVVARAQEAGIRRIINASTGIESCFRSVELAARFPSVYAAIGVHPQDITGSLPDFSQMESLFASPRVVAVGEVGLDYYWDTTYWENQKKALRLQIELAEHYHLPVIVHSRSSDDDLLKICRESVRNVPLIWHCFAGDEETLRRAIQKDYSFSLGGIMTFPKAERLRKIIPLIPLEKLLLETDAPYLAPQAKRGKRNEPSFLIYTAERVASLFSLSREALRERIYQNCVSVFGDRLFSEKTTTPVPGPIIRNS